MSIDTLRAKLDAVRNAAQGTKTPETKTPEASTASAPAATQPPTRALLDGAKASEPATEPPKAATEAPKNDTKAKLEALRAKVKKSEPKVDAPTRPSDEPAKAEAPKVEPVATTPAPGLAELAAREAAAAPHVTTTEAPGETVKTEVRKGETRPVTKAMAEDVVQAMTKAIEDKAEALGVDSEDLRTAAVEQARAKLTGPRCRFLLLNALPAVGLVATPLETFLEPVLETIKRETGKNWQMHAYREGTGMIVDGIARAAEHGLIPEVLSIDTTTALGKVAIEALMHRADVVISGRAA